MEIPSFCYRLIQSQKGNVLLYAIGFVILWFVFFSIKDWIKESKETRGNRPHEEKYEYSDPYLANAAKANQ